MYKSLLYISLLLLSLNNIWAQSLAIPENHGEDINIRTNANTYLSQQKIYISASYQAPCENEIETWSKVLYVELISHSGEALAQTKLQINIDIAQGFLQIPSSVKSGNYYLRAYTLWMRNYSPYNYSYLPIKIINPTTLITEDYTNSFESSFKIPESSATIVELDLITKDYKSAETVSINLPNLHLSGPIAISVIKEGLFNVTQSNSFVFQNEIEQIPHLSYLPEINGLSLNGLIIDNDGKKISSKKVNLSSYSNSFFHSSALTDTDGSVTFTFPNMEGNCEFHIATEDTSDNYKLQILKGFCPKEVSLPYIPFNLTEEEKSSIEEQLLDIQLQNIFEGNNDDDEIGPDFKAFFGSPTASYKIKDFIILKDINEFFFELIPTVSIGSKKKEKFLFFNRPSILKALPPLILLDNVLVKNNNELLAVRCKDIQQIDILNKGYMIGSFVYSGIISIHSKNKDLDYFKNRDNSQFFSYQFFGHGTSEVSAPSNEEDLKIPNKRSYLYWNSDLRNSEQDSNIKVEFQTSKAKGKYGIYIMSKDATSGKAKIIYDTFTVK